MQTSQYWFDRWFNLSQLIWSSITMQRLCIDHDCQNTPSENWDAARWSLAIPPISRTHDSLKMINQQKNYRDRNSPPKQDSIYPDRDPDWVFRWQKYRDRLWDTARPYPAVIQICVVLIKGVSTQPTSVAMYVDRDRTVSSLNNSQENTETQVWQKMVELILPRRFNTY